MSTTRPATALLTCAFLCTNAAAQAIPAAAPAQDPSPPSAESKQEAAIDNPFRQWRLAVEQQALQSDPAPSGMEGGVVLGGYGSATPAVGGIGYGGMDMYGGETYGSGGYGGGGYGSPPGEYGGGYGGEGQLSPSQLFQQAIQVAVMRLAQAESDAQKQKLLEVVRGAFNERYEQAIARRQQQLEQLEKQLQQLREDLERRRSAQQKVVEVQLRTVELAGEGLVELSSKQ